VADELLARGYRVPALGALVPQVHGPARARPPYLDPSVELVVGDVRDPQAFAASLRGIDVVVHAAAAVGVGQSMYEIATYTEPTTSARPSCSRRSCGHPWRGWWYSPA